MVLNETSGSKCQRLNIYDGKSGSSGLRFVSLWSGGGGGAAHGGCKSVCKSPRVPRRSVACGGDGRGVNGARGWRPDFRCLGSETWGWSGQGTAEGRRPERASLHRLVGLGPGRDDLLSRLARSVRAPPRPAPRPTAPRRSHVPTRSHAPRRGKEAAAAAGVLKAQPRLRPASAAPPTITSRPEPARDRGSRDAHSQAGRRSVGE